MPPAARTASTRAASTPSVSGATTITASACLRRRDERYDLAAARHNDPPCCGRQVDRQRLIDEGGDIEAAVAYRVGDKRAKHRPPLTGQRADVVARMKHEFTVGPRKAPGTAPFVDDETHQCGRGDRITQVENLCYEGISEGLPVPRSRRC